jgi:hypothetical protein
LAPHKLSDFKLSGVTLRADSYRGSPAFALRVPSSSYRHPTKERLSDRNVMAWLPIDFGHGPIEVEITSDLAPDAPDDARGFVGFAYRMDEPGRPRRCVDRIRDHCPWSASSGGSRELSVPEAVALIGRPTGANAPFL